MASEQPPKRKSKRGVIHHLFMVIAALTRNAGRWLRLSVFLLLIGLNIAVPIAMTMSEVAFSAVARFASVLVDGVDLLTKERKKTSAVTAELKKSNEYNSLREKQLKSQNQQISGQKKKLAQFEVDAKAHSKQLGHLTAQIDEIKARPAKAKVMLGGELMFADEAIRKTRKKVDDRLAKSLSKEIASLGAEAIPYVGIAVMIAFLIDDVKESCAAVQDIQDLANAFNGTQDAAPGEVCAQASRIPLSITAVWNRMIAAPVAAYGIAKENLPEFHWQAGWDDLVENTGSVIGYLSGWIGIQEN